MKNNENSDTYLLKIPEEFVTVVMSDLINRGVYITKLKPIREYNGIQQCEVIFTCPRIAGFQEWLRGTTHGRGTLEITTE